MLRDVLSIHFTLQRPVILTLILYPNPDISLNWYHTDVTSLPDLCETVFSLQTSKRFALHSSHIHSPLMVMAVDFMGLFHYKGNKTAGYTEMQDDNHYSTARETIILTLSDFLSLTGCEAFMLWTKPATAFKTLASQVNDNDNLVTISFSTRKFWLPRHKLYHPWFKTKYSPYGRIPLAAWCDLQHNKHLPGRAGRESADRPRWFTAISHRTHPPVKPLMDWVKAQQFVTVVTLD